MLNLFIKKKQLGDISIKNLKTWKRTNNIYVLTHQTSELLLLI